MGISRKMIVILLVALLVIGTTGSLGYAQESGDKESVALSFWSGVIAGTYQDGIQTDPIAKRIEEKTGVTVDWILNPTDEKLSALMASRSLPDIIVAPWSFTNQLVSGGLVLDMRDLLESRGQDIKKNLAPASLEFSYDILSGSTGALYFLPLEAYAPEDAAMPDTVWGGVYTRWDLYKQMGYPALNSMDDYLDLVAKMLEANPVNEDGLKNYGFSLWFDWGPFIHTDTMTRQHLGVETLEIGCDPVEYDRVTLEPYSRYFKDDSAFWAGVEFWYKANRMGLLDPDSFTQTYDMAFTKYDSNRVLATVISWLTPNPYYRAKGVYDKGFFGPIPIVGSRSYYYDGWISGNEAAVAISSSCKNPERAMDLLNWMNSTEGLTTITNGIEGVDWVKEGDEYRYTDTYRQNNLDPNASNLYGYAKYSKGLIVSPSRTIPGTDQPFNIALSKSVQKESLLQPDQAIAKEACGYYGVDLPYEILPEGGKYEYSNASLIKALLPVEISDEEIKLIDYRVQTYLQEAVVQIMNASDDADFAAQKQKIQQEIKDMGVDQVYDYWAQRIEEARAKISR